MSSMLATRPALKIALGMRRSAAIYRRWRMMTICLGRNVSRGNPRGARRRGGDLAGSLDGRASVGDVAKGDRVVIWLLAPASGVTPDGRMNGHGATEMFAACHNPLEQ